MLRTRGIRIDDKTWAALKRLANPEQISVFVRKYLRDLAEGKKK